MKMRKKSLCKCIQICKAEKFFNLRLEMLIKNKAARFHLALRVNFSIFWWVEVCAE